MSPDGSGVRRRIASSEQADRLALLAEVAHSLSQARHPDEALDAAVGRLCRSGRFRAAAVYTRDESGRLAPSGCVGSAAGNRPAWEALAQTAWLRGVAEGAASLPPPGASDAAGEPLIAVPLTSGVATLGALVLAPADPGGDWAEFGRLVGLLAGQHLAVARASARIASLEDDQMRLSRTDALTGLPNQIAFAQRVTEEMRKADAARSVVAVSFLDLDRFRTVNNALGHAIGDRLLRAAARRLVARLGEGAVFRMSGDEFVLMIGGLSTEEEAAERAEAAREAFLEPFECEGNDVYVTASVGVALYPFDGEDIQTLVKNADSAMFRAKENGGNLVQFYAPALFEHASRRLSMEGRLHRALERDEIVLHFQPIVDAGAGSVVGMEVLARWQHPDLGLVLPDKFIWLAEETGLIVALGERILHDACVRCAGWNGDGLAVPRVWVNLATRQFHQTELIDTVDRTLKETGLSPSGVGFEITEGVAMRYPGRTIAVLRELRERGIETALDDFGTGYSSLDHLRRFSIDALKLDRSFVRGVATESNDAAIARAVIALAHSLGLTVVAEGVETSEQRRFLAAEGCDTMQGFLFGVPAPAEGCAALLTPV